MGYATSQSVSLYVDTERFTLGKRSRIEASLSRRRDFTVPFSKRGFEFNRLWSCAFLYLLPELVSFQTTDRNTYVKGRSIAAFAIFLESAAFTSQTIEVRATEGHFYDNRGMPSEQRDRWKSSASIGSAALEGKRYDVAIRFLSAALDGAVKSEDAAHLHGLRGDAYLGKGDSDKALADYARAVNFVAKNTVDYVMHGLTYEKMGNYKAAASDHANGIALYCAG